MAVTFLQGMLTSISANFINPYTGEILTVDGDYYVNNTPVVGTSADDDILLSSVENQFFRLEDASGNILIQDIEIILTSDGDDILDLTSTSHALGNMLIEASGGDDIIWSNVGDDIIRGGEGNDILNGGHGNDEIDGGLENDTLIGAGGDDTLEGGDGEDTAVFQGSIEDYDITFNEDGTITIADTVVGRDDTDTLSNIEYVTFLEGTLEATPEVLTPPEPDPGLTLTGTNQRDLLIGSDFADSIFGRNGNDLLVGHDGDDFMDGENGKDILIGGDGNDEMHGGNGHDMLWGAADNDLMFGENGKDWLFGGDGNDEMHGGAGKDALMGGDDDDVLYGEDGKDWLFGGRGDDTLYGGEGRDIMFGGSGADTFVFEGDSAFTGSDIIVGFSMFGGDSLDISDVLEGYDPLADALSDFVRVTTGLFHSTLYVDADGGGDAFVEIASMYGLLPLGFGNVDQLEDNGVIVTV